MPDEVDCAVGARRGQVAEHRLQKGGELGLRHLARRHRDLGVLDRAEAADVAVDRHVVGRVGEHDRDQAFTA